MPNSVVKSYAKKLQSGVSEIEDKWEKAEQIAKEKMEKENKRNKGYSAEKDDSYYPYVMGIFKNMFTTSQRKKLKLESITSRDLVTFLESIKTAQMIVDFMEKYEKTVGQK